MSLGGRSETVGFLRDAIARIEGDGSLAPGFADGQVARGRVPLGRVLTLDRLLCGGLARGAVHEIVAGRPGDAAAASGFALALAARFAGSCGEAKGNLKAKSKPIVWILEDAARAETGMPYAPGLCAHGIETSRLVVVATATTQDSLWAMEEALKSTAVGAVIADLWRTKAYDLVASRRLVLAAQKSGTPGLVVPAGAAGQVDALSSAARTRFEVRAMSGHSMSGDSTSGHATSGHATGGFVAPADTRLPLPGRAAWAVRLARIRAGPGLAAGFDRDRFWPLVWDHEEAWFCDALPLSLLADARHRPPAADANGHAA